MEKDFDKWNKQKQKINTNNHKPPFVKEGDIWWVSIGENIGSEIDGKSDLFSRPVIIIKKLSHNFYFCIPTTTKNKEGNWYISFKQKDTGMFACLHQARSIDYRRLSSKLGQLDESDIKKIKEAFLLLLS